LKGAALSDIETVKTEFVFEAEVCCAAPLVIGPSAYGKRQLIPISGGKVKGKIEGAVLAGGADWQLTRPDGITEIVARYTIQASDGALISVINRGIANRKGGTPAYVRTVPSFEAPNDSPHAWLNESIFVGTLAVKQMVPQLIVLVNVFRVI
jgi:Protein of unknown function (DUF3237)